MRFISRSADLRGFGNQNVHFWDQYRPTIKWFPHFSSSAIHIPVNIRILKNYYLICLNLKMQVELVSLFPDMFHVCITETQVNMWSLEHSSLNQPNLQIRLISTWKMHGGFSGVLLTPVWNSKKENILSWKTPTRWAHWVLFLTEVLAYV